MGLLDGVDRLHAGLDYHLARHNILTSNLAHLDTPNFKPLDLQQADGSFDQAMKLALAQTDEGHLQAPATGTNPAAAKWKTIEDPTSVAGADGNGVSVDREASKIAANQVRYDALASLVGGELNGLAWAANDGKAG